MTLDDALRQLAADLGLDAEELIRFSLEDGETGWDYNQGTWMIGSLFAADGRLLYALARALQPSTLLEFGVRQGCSSKHMLMALVANRSGRLISCDPEPLIDESRFTKTEQKRWTVLRYDGAVADLPAEVDLVFEDATHETPLTAALLRRSLELSPRIILSHDAEHFLVGDQIRAAWNEVIGSYRTLKIDGTDCGFAYWVNPERA